MGRGMIRTMFDDDCPVIDRTVAIRTWAILIKVRMQGIENFKIELSFSGVRFEGLVFQMRLL